MKHVDASGPKNRPVNISVPSEDITEAKRLGLNVSQIARTALAHALREEKKRRYIEENREAIAEYNNWVEKHGVLITPIWMHDDVMF